MRYIFLLLFYTLGGKRHDVDGDDFVGDLKKKCETEGGKRRTDSKRIAAHDFKLDAILIFKYSTNFTIKCCNKFLITSLKLIQFSC